LDPEHDELSTTPSTLHDGFAPGSRAVYNGVEKAGDMMKLTAVFMAVPEGYIGFVEELPGANTLGETLEEARENLREAVQMVLDANRELAAKAIAGHMVSREPFDLTSP
jgi:predicted RNase H-like HicB family nuclease